MAKIKYYSLDKIKEENAIYNLIIGERSNGKTSSVLEEGLKIYCRTGKQMAIIRRWDEDFKHFAMSSMFDSLSDRDLITEYSNGQYNSVKAIGRKWYLCKFDDELNKEIIDENPFALGFSLTMQTHYKSTSFPSITTILFDEFIDKNYYLPDEFTIYMNLISTICRARNDVKIYMCGNTINQYCPYFNEMGLNHIKNMQPGTIDVYNYGDSELKVAVERTAPLNKQGKPSDIYFAFDNPKLEMITGGVWELETYPHLQPDMKYKPSEVIYTYYIIFDDEILQCNIVNKDDYTFTHIHHKTTPIKDNNTNLVYTPKFNYQPNYRKNIFRPQTITEKKILNYFQTDSVVYQTNSIGECVRNYLMYCKKN